MNSANSRIKYELIIIDTQINDWRNLINSIPIMASEHSTLNTDHPNNHSTQLSIANTQSNKSNILIYTVSNTLTDMTIQGGNWLLEEKLGRIKTALTITAIHYNSLLATIEGTAVDDYLYGSSADDIFHGYGGKDYMDGKAGNDSLNGGDGNDMLWGDINNDLLNGDNGDDYLNGEAGDDSLNGGNDNDDLYGNDGNDYLSGDNGDDYLDGEAGDDTLNGGAGNDTLWGDINNDLLNGSSGDDYLDGETGNDTLNGGSGDDTLNGGSGDDTYYIDTINDTIWDSMGDDTVYIAVNAYPIPEEIEHIIYSQGAQALAYFITALDSGYYWGKLGMAQTLTYSFVSANLDNNNDISSYDTNQETAVRQALAKYSDIAAITFIETNDNPTVQLRFFRDNLIGYENAAGYAYYPSNGDIHIKTDYTDLAPDSYGFQILLHEIGHALGLKHPFEDGAILNSAEDNSANTVMSYTFTEYNSTDIAIFDQATIHYLYGVNIKARADNNTYSISDRYIWDGAGLDTLSAAKETQAVYLNLIAGSWIYAGAKSTSILADNQAFVAYGTVLENAIGGHANDTLQGNAEFNLLDGGLGADTMMGALGNDSYYVDNKDDSVIETSSLSTEIDSVYSSISYTLPANIERLLLTKTAPINGTGNSLKNTLFGNSATNSLNGGSNADTLIGGLGNDSYYVDNSADSINESSTLSTEIDKVYSSVSYTLGNNLEHLVLTGTAAINGTGNSLKNTLFGNSAANSLNGGSNADTLIGGLGNDSYYVDNSADSINESSTLSTEIDKVYSSVSYTLGNNLEHLVLTGTAAINGTGNSLHNTVLGNNAANTLRGASGKDTLTGGLGADRFVFNTIADTGLSATTADTISDFKSSESDKIDLATIDADIIATGNNTFTAPIISGAFSDVLTTRGALYFDTVHHVLYGNNDVDTKADFAIALLNVSSLSATDFIL